MLGLQGCDQVEGCAVVRGRLGWLTRTPGDQYDSRLVRARRACMDDLAHGYEAQYVIPSTHCRHGQSTQDGAAYDRAEGAGVKQATCAGSVSKPCHRVGHGHTYKGRPTLVTADGSSTSVQALCCADTLRPPAPCGCTTCQSKALARVLGIVGSPAGPSTVLNSKSHIKQ